MSLALPLSSCKFKIKILRDTRTTRIQLETIAQTGYRCRTPFVVFDLRDRKNQR